MDEAMAGLYETGRAVFADLVAGGAQRLDTMFAATPALAELAVGTVYGHLHARQALDPRTREAVALAAIIASGMVESPFAVHVRTGLANGLTPAEIGEIIVETAAFAGFPRAVTAAGKLAALLAEAGSPVPPQPSPREALLAVLAEPDQAPEHVRALLAAGSVQVLTTGPDAAIALFTDADGGLLGVAHAQVDKGEVRELTTVSTSAFGTR